MVIDIDKQLIEYQTALETFANSLTRNWDDANDLFQETVYKIIKHKDKYIKGTNFRAWSHTIMRNIFINNYRSKKRRQTLSNEQIGRDFLSNNSKLATLNEGQYLLENHEIKNILSKLSEDLREPFMLRYEGFKYEEIAEILDLPLGTVKSRIHFARKKLAEVVSFLQED